MRKWEINIDWNKERALSPIKIIFAIDIFVIEINKIYLCLNLMHCVCIYKIVSPSKGILSCFTTLPNFQLCLTHLPFIKVAPRMLKMSNQSQLAWLGWTAQSCWNNCCRTTTTVWSICKHLQNRLYIPHARVRACVCVWSTSSAWNVACDIQKDN